MRRLANTTYRSIHNINDELHYSNLIMIVADKIPDLDLLIVGFPCQIFYVIGRQEGFSDDSGQIIFHLSRIYSETKPTSFIQENVKGL